MYIKRTADKIVRLLLEGSKIIILLGARQVGKTTLIEPFVREKDGLLLNCDIDIDKTRLIAASKLAPLATQDKPLKFPSLSMLTIGTRKSFRPSHQAEILIACLICGKHILKFHYVYRIQLHRLFSYYHRG